MTHYVQYRMNGKWYDQSRWDCQVDATRALLNWQRINPGVPWRVYHGRPYTETQ